jgi:cell division protein FtsZ
MIIKLQVLKTYCCSSFLGSNEITLDEIGEINDHSTEAGFNANIMGVGEDETLGDAIAVTIATGLILNNKTES